MEHGESRWAWKIEASGAGVISAGTDNFINICINRSKEIRSRGGRLYCTVPPYAFYKITRVG